MENRKYIDVDFYHYSIHFSMNFSHYELYMYVLPTCIYITKCLKEKKKRQHLFSDRRGKEMAGAVVKTKQDVEIETAPCPVLTFSL